jgi:diguanylate cyclase (GGDEF)-like protein
VKRLYRSLSFKLIVASVALILVAIGLGGVMAFKVSEDAIKEDALLSARDLARGISSYRETGEEGNPGLVDILVSLKVSKFGAAWVMDKNGFLIAHMDPKYRNAADAQTFIGDTIVELNAIDQPIGASGEKGLTHKVMLQEIFDRFDGGYGTYTSKLTGEPGTIAFRIVKDKGWLAAVDQPTGTAFSELRRIKRIILFACVAMGLAAVLFTWFAVAFIIQPYYQEKEEASVRLASMNSELEGSKRKIERAANSLARLYDLSISMQFSGFLESHLPLVLGVAQERFDVDRLLLFMPDEEGKFLRCRASVGNVFESEEKVLVPLGEGGGALARAFLSRRTIVNDGSSPLPADLRIVPPYSQIRTLRTRAFAVFPLMSKERVIGVLGVDNKLSRRPLTREDMDAIESFSYKVASLIENTIHFQEIRRAHSELGKRDGLTGLYHIRHMRELGAARIQEALRDGVPLSAATVYLANFKEYNEVNGYQRGEFVLQKVADLLKGQEVMGAVPGRCFGATFLILYPGKNREQGKYLLDQFVKEISAFSFYGDKQVQAGRLVVEASLAEYDRASGESFDEFFNALEGLRGE